MYNIYKFPNVQDHNWRFKSQTAKTCIYFTISHLVKCFIHYGVSLTFHKSEKSKSLQLSQNCRFEGILCLCASRNTQRMIINFHCFQKNDS